MGCDRQHEVYYRAPSKEALKTSLFESSALVEFRGVNTNSIFAKIFKVENVLGVSDTFLFEGTTVDGEEIKGDLHYFENDGSRATFIVKRPMLTLTTEALFMEIPLGGW